MAREERSLAQIKASILDFVEHRGEASSLDELLVALNAQGVQSDQIKAALWALISESAVELTSTYMIQAGRPLQARAS